MKSFSASHPIILLMYYLAVMIVTVFFLHPIVLIISFLGSLIFSFTLKSSKEIKKDLRIYTILFLIVVLTNPLFVHEGETVLLEIWHRQITLEAFLYGIFIGLMLIAVISWSRLYSEMMTTDKFVYVFGKAIPKTSLILTMSLRFIPLFIKQIGKISMTQQTFNIYPSNSIKHRIMQGIQVFQIMITWSLENAINQADSMKARGYGLSNRTNFAIFRWSYRDTIIGGLIGSAFILILYFGSKNYLTFQYYPNFNSSKLLEMHPLVWIIVSLLMFLPSMLEMKEQIKWKYIQSKI